MYVIYLKNEEKTSEKIQSTQKKFPINLKLTYQTFGKSEQIKVKNGPKFDIHVLYNHVGWICPRHLNSIIII